MSQQESIEIKCTEKERNLIIFAIGIAEGVLSLNKELGYQEQYRKLFEGISWQTRETED